jgi:apolipoprotein N-acyltransferase
VGSSVATTSICAVRTDASGLSVPAAAGLTVLSALVYAAGFPPLSWPLAPWLALVPLLIACAALPPAQAALLGLGWAATAATAVAWFLPGMLSAYFGLGTAASWLATVTVVGGLHGLYLGAYTAWVAWLVRRKAANPILLAGGWMAAELARVHGGLSSPWALSAYSQVGWTPIIQIADLAGPFGLGLLIAAVNAVIAAALVPALRGRRPRLSAALVAAAVMLACAYGHWRLGQRFADGAPVPVAIVQGGAAPERAAQRAARLARQVALSRAAGDVAGGLIVWPEHAVEAYLEESSPTREAVLRLAGESGADVVLGGPYFAPAAGGTRYHNSAYLVRDGRVAARYDKHRLVPFAEDGQLAGLRRGAATAYTAGSGSFVLPASPLRLGTLLCVEAMFGDLARRAVNDGAEVLVTLSNDGWFGHPEPARHQLEIAALRAVETRRYLVRAASTGISAIIDPHGRTLVESGFDTHQALHGTVRASHATTIYQRWGDIPAWLVVAGVALATLLHRGRGPKPTRRFV